MKIFLGLELFEQKIDLKPVGVTEEQQKIDLKPVGITAEQLKKDLEPYGPEASQQAEVSQLKDSVKREISVLAGGEIADQSYSIIGEGKIEPGQGFFSPLGLALDYRDATNSGKFDTIGRVGGDLTGLATSLKRTIESAQPQTNVTLQPGNLKIYKGNQTGALCFTAPGKFFVENGTKLKDEPVKTMTIRYTKEGGFKLLTQDDLDTIYMKSLTQLIEKDIEESKNKNP